MIRSRKYIFLFLMLLSYGSSQAYRNVPALTHLNRAEQQDTIGFNLVEGLCSLLYPGILNGSIPLYVSPEKKLRIDAHSLLALESSTGTRFEACPDLFIHEYWSSNRRSTLFQIVGFSFINKNMLNEKVAFGYIDVQDIDSLLHHQMIPNTANGSYGISYDQALLSRKYNFHLVQMGEEAFYSNPVQSIILKREAFFSGKEIRNQSYIPARKQLAYQVQKKKYTTDIDWSNELVLAIEQVLKNNPELFMNLGGQRYDSFPAIEFLIPEVRGLLIEEIWIKDNRKARIESAKIKIILSNGDLQWMDLAELENYGIILHYKSLREILTNKPFGYDLFRLNDQEIDPAYGPLYMDALKKSPWNKINSYVAQ